MQGVRVFGDIIELEAVDLPLSPSSNNPAEFLQAFQEPRQVKLRVLHAVLPSCYRQKRLQCSG